MQTKACGQDWLLVLGEARKESRQDMGSSQPPWCPRHLPVCWPGFWSFQSLDGLRSNGELMPRRRLGGISRVDKGPMEPREWGPCTALGSVYQYGGHRAFTHAVTQRGLTGSVDSLDFPSPTPVGPCHSATADTPHPHTGHTTAMG